MVYAMAMTAQRYTITAATGEEIAHEFAGTIRPVKPLIVKIENRRKAETA